jgi:hypothetical protein
MNAYHPILLALCAIAPLAAQTATYRDLPTMPGLAAHFAYDSHRGRVLAAENSPEPRFWEWDGSTWSARLGSGLPSGSMLGAVYDSVRRRFQVVGSAAIREWDGARWLQRSATLPNGSSAQQFAFDDRRGRIVALVLGTVQEWDGIQWRQVGSGGPGQRSDPAFTYDPLRQACVLYGGGISGTGTTMADVWRWDGSTWTQEQANAAPGPRSRASLAFEPSTGRLVLYGGDTTATWALSGSQWQQVATTTDPGPRSFAKLVWDGSGLLLHDSTTTRAGLIWRFAQGDWNGLPGGQPVPRYLPALGVHQTSGQIALFGGQTGSFSSASLLADTWTFANGAWQLHVQTVAPPPHTDPVFAWSALNQALLLGGEPNAASAATWLWDGSQWQQRLTAVAPPPRRHASLAADPNGGVLLFGGIGSGSMLGDHWLWNGTAWQQLAPATVPPPRYNAPAALDPVRGVVVLACGLDPSFRNDTWEWDGASWTNRGQSPFTGMPSPESGSAAFRPDTGRVRVELAQTFEWDGLTWNTATVTGTQWSARLATDGARQRLVRFGAAGFATLTPTPGAGSRYGASCSLGPAPGLSTAGSPVPGNTTLAVVASSPAASAPALVAFGLDDTPTPLGGGCSLLVATVVTTSFALTDTLGDLRLPLPIPFDLSLRGVDLFAQLGVLDAARGRYAGLALSEGLQIRIGD